MSKKDFYEEELIESEDFFISCDKDVGIYIWEEELEDGGSSIFINYKNITLNLPESDFYHLVKTAQKAVKKLLDVK